MFLSILRQTGLSIAVRIEIIMNNDLFIRISNRLIELLRALAKRQIGIRKNKEFWVGVGEVDWIGLVERGSKGSVVIEIKIDVAETMAMALDVDVVLGRFLGSPVDPSQ